MNITTTRPVCNARESYEGAVPCQLAADHAGAHMRMLADLSAYITWEQQGTTSRTLAAWAAHQAIAIARTTMAAAKRAGDAVAAMIARTRAGRVFAAVMVVATRHIPWLAVVFTACLIIPGPFDEIAALIVVFVYAAFKPAMRAELAVAIRTK